MLIDTVVQGLPMPLILLRDLPPDLKTHTSRKEVVDGQQRLRTLAAFIAPNVLGDFDPARDAFTVLPSHNSSIAKKTFEQLNDGLKRRILDYQISVHIFPSTTGDEIILNVFARLNSTGARLNPQELRNAMYFGEFKTLMYRLSSEQLGRWRRWGVFSEDALARMSEVELTSDVVNLIVNGVGAKNKSALDKLYKSFDESFPDADIVARRFESVMDAIDTTLGAEMEDLGLTRVAMFYAVFAVIYDAQYGLRSKLKKARAKKVPTKLMASVRKAAARVKTGTASARVQDALRGRPSHKKPRETVIAYLTKF